MHFEKKLSVYDLQKGNFISENEVSFGMEILNYIKTNTTFTLFQNNTSVKFNWLNVKPKIQLLQSVIKNREGILFKQT